MEKPEKGKDSWVSLTASGIVTTLPCELIYVDMCPSAANAEVAIYDGIDAAGKPIHNIFAAVKLNSLFAPIKPVYCETGLYIVHTANVTRTFVQYRNVPRV